MVKKIVVDSCENCPYRYHNEKRDICLIALMSDINQLRPLQYTGDLAVLLGMEESNEQTHYAKSIPPNPTVIPKWCLLPNDE